MSVLAMLGMLGAGAISSAAQVKTNEANLKHQLQTNAWSQQLADSAHQREVIDLYKAGLNPILSASGAGAGVPSLGTASMSNPGEGIANGISSASNLVSDQYKANVDSVKANTAQVKEINSALKADRVVEDTKREYEKLIADAKKSSLEDMMGFRTYYGDDGFSIRVLDDPKKYNRFKLGLKAGILSDAFNSAGSLISKFNPLKGK